MLIMLLYFLFICDTGMMCIWLLVSFCLNGINIYSLTALCVLHVLNCI